MTETDRYETLETLRLRAGRNPRLKEADCEILDAGGGKLVLTVMPPASAINGNGSGTVHGGFLFSVCDTACAFACMSQSDGGVTQSAHITYVRPGKEGERLRVEAHEVARTRRSQTFDAKILTPRGETVAIFRGIFQLIEKKAAKG